MFGLIFSTEQRSILSKFIFILISFYNHTSTPSELQYSLVNTKAIKGAHSYTTR